MGEEFQESDIIFSDTTFANDEDVCLDHRKSRMHSAQHNIFIFHDCNNNKKDHSSSKKKTKKKRNRSSFSSSIPIDIPENIFNYVDRDDAGEELDDKGDMVPPHVLVARRMVRGNMASSVCTGNGRKLKGRDLSQVRNSILRMTGFLEA